MRAEQKQIRQRESEIQESSAQSLAYERPHDPIAQLMHRRLSPKGASASPVSFIDPTKPVLQAKARILGNHKLKDKGEFKIDFEERLWNDSAGMYGYIGFYPVKEGPSTREIELVQIASLVSNNKGQALSQGASEQDLSKIKETMPDTSGEAPIKDLMRINSPERHHIDLTFAATLPRQSDKELPYSQAYNAERRGQRGRWKAWDDPMDEIYMDPSGTVQNESQNQQRLKRNENIGLQKRKITQLPGFINHKSSVQATELFDYPRSPEPSKFDFETSVVADGTHWTTVTWGFETINDSSELGKVSKVDKPAFKDQESKIMYESRRLFDHMLANPRASTSPEFISQIIKEKDKKEQAKMLKSAFLGSTLVLGRFERVEKNKGRSTFLLHHFQLAKRLLKLGEALKGETEFDQLSKEVVRLTPKKVEVNDGWGEATSSTTISSAIDTKVVDKTTGNKDDDDVPDNWDDDLSDED